MSRQIDERVVEMRFDNAQFEKNVSTTMSTLDQFKQKLNFRGAGKGLEEIGAAAQKVDMRGLGNGIEEVRMKFSALQVVGVTALANITNSALNAGKRIASALTIDPVKTGFQEYETKMNAIQVIKANTRGKNTMDEITAALDELNTYADKTIYNFAQMTSNIGKFTAQGLDVKKATEAVKGMANLAAASGASAEDMARATYQMSQSLSGTIKMIDWNSLRNANMATTELKNTLIDLAKVHGIAIDDMIAKEGSFEQTLSKGWLTGEMFTEAMNIYSGVYSEAELKAKGFTDSQIKNFQELAAMAESAATEVKTFSQLWDVLKETAQSGWTQTWELIIGDFDTAKNMLTSLQVFFSGIIDRMSDARNSVLESALGKSFTSLAKNIDTLLSPAKKAADTVTKVKDSLEDLGDIVDKVIIGGFGNGKERFDKLTAAGENYYRVQNKVNEKLGNSFRYTEEQIAAQDKLLGIQEKAVKGSEKEASAASSLTKAQKNTLTMILAMNEAEMKSAGFTEEQIAAFQELQSTAEKLGIPLGEFIDNLDQINGRWLFINSFKNVGLGLISTFNAIGKAWKEVFPISEEEKANRLFNVFATFHKVTRSFRDSLEANADEISRTFKGLFAALDIITTIVGGPIKIAFKILVQLLGAFDLNILDVTANIGDAIVKFRDWIDSILDFSGLFEKISPYISEFIKNVKEVVQSLKDSKVIDKFVKSFNKLVKAFKKILTLDITKLNFSDIADQILEFFTSIPNDMKKIGENIIEGLQNGIGGKLSSIIEKAKEIGNKIIETVKEILGIHSPSTVMFEIGENIVEGLVNGIASGIQFVIDGAAKIGNYIVDLCSKLNFSPIADMLSNGFKKLKAALGNFDWKKLLAIIPVAVILVVVKQIYDFTKAIVDGIDSVNELIGGFAGIEKSISKVLNAKAFETAAEGLKKVATSIAILAGAVVVLSMVDETNLYRSVGVIVVLSIVLTLLAKAMTKMQAASATIGKDGLKVAGVKTGLLTLGAAILLLAETVKLMGDINPEQAKQGFIGLVKIMGAMLIFIGALRVISIGKSAIQLPAITSTLTGIAVAMAMMVGVCKLTSKLNKDDLENGAIFAGGFLAFVGAFTAIAKTKNTKYIPKLSKLLISLSISMLLMVGVCKLAGTLSEDDMKAGAIFAAGFLAFISTFVAIAKTKATKYIPKLSALLISMSVSMLLMIGVCKLAANLSEDDIKAGALFAGGFLVFVILLVKLTTIGNDKKMANIAATLIAMSVAVAILAGVAVLLSLLDPEGLMNGVAAIVALSLGMAAMVAAAKGAEKCVGNILALSLAVGLMAGAVAALTFIDQEKLWNSVITMEIMMGMFALIMKMTESMGQVSLTLLAMSLAIGVLGGVLYLLASLPTESSIGAAIALSIAMLAFAGAMRIISGMQAPSGMALVAIGVMALVVGALGGVLYLLQGLTISEAVVIISSITAFLGILIGAITLMGFVDGPSSKALVALAAVTLVVAVLAGVLYALQNVDPNQAMGIVTAISYFLGAMMAVCGAAIIVGKFAGPAALGLMVMVGFIGALGLVIIGLTSLAMDVIAGMPKLGSDLSAFMTNVQPFIDGIQNIPDDISDKIGKLSAAILKLTGTEIVDAIASFFTGGSSLADLGAELLKFGEGMASFSSSLGNIDAAVSSMSKVKDIQDAIKDVDLSALSSIAEPLETFSVKASKLNITAVNTSIIIANKLVRLVESLGDVDYSGVSRFKVTPLAQGMLMYSLAVSGLNQSAISASINSANKLKDFINSLVSLDASGISGFKTAISQLGSVSINSIVKSFSSGNTQLYKAGSDLIIAVTNGMKSSKGKITSTVQGIVVSIQSAFKSRTSYFLSAGKELASALNNGLSSKKSTIAKTVQSIANSTSSSIRLKYSSFYSAGGYLAEGFAAGISASSFKAEATASAMAQAALDAAKEVLRMNSPSKATREIGEYFGQGFINGISSYADKAYSSSSDMANSARAGLSDAISRIQNVLNSDMDTQPTIRPILDLSDITDNANKITSLFDMSPSVGVMANVGAISNGMNSRQNGKTNEDVISAINGLRDFLSTKTGDTYTIGNITYDDGSEISNAVKTLVRAARVERRA